MTTFTGSAPGRVNLIGEHVDYNSGRCLPIAVQHRTRVTLRPRDDGRIRLSSAQLPQTYELGLADVGPGRPAGWGGYAAGVLALLARAGHRITGADVHVDSSVPLGAGLSSSAALEAATGAAASRAFGLGLLADDASRAELAALCRRVENEVVGVPTGGMDQSAVLRSRAGHASLLDCRDDSIEHVPFEPDSDGVALLVIDTRAVHALADGQYAARRGDCERAAAILGVPALRDIGPGDLAAAEAQLPDGVLRRRVRHVVREIERVRLAAQALRSADWVAVGVLFSASHASLRDLFEVSCPELDETVRAALGAGALGARLTGGGFGGSAIALVPAARTGEISVAIRAAFGRHGWREPDIFPVTAGPGAD